MRIVLEAVLLKLHTNLSPGWVLIRVNLDPIQEIGPKAEGGHSCEWALFRETTLYSCDHAYGNLQD